MKFLNIKFRIKYFFYSILAVNSLLLILSLVCPFVSPHSFQIIPAIGLFFPIFFIVNTLFILALTVKKKKALVVPLLLGLFSLSAFFKVFGFDYTDQFDGQATVNVATFNLQFSKPLAFQEADKYDAMANAFNNFLETQESIDVLLLQELGDLSASHLDAVMDFPFKHKHEKLTVGIYSKYPIIDKGIVDFKSNTANACLWADIKLPSDTVRFYSYHLESNRENGKVPKKIAQAAPESRSLKMMFGLVKYYHRFTLKRLNQVALVRQHFKSSKHPVVLGGDLNDTPQSYVYRQMSKGMQDAFIKEGWGSGKTILSKTPWLRIDNIFVDQQMDIVGHDILHTPFSDHALIKACLEVE